MGIFDTVFIRLNIKILSLRIGHVYKLHTEFVVLNKHMQEICEKSNLGVEMAFVDVSQN